MARVSLENKIPQIGKPVGSRDRVEALTGEVGLRNIATCSRFQERVNRGCSEYGECDREFRGTRPHNEIVHITTADGNVRTQCMACFETVRKERDADAKQMLIEVIGGEGDEYTYRGSVKLHPKRDPNCNKCAEGKCEAYVDKDDLKATCPPFPEPEEHRELVKFARIREARGRIKGNTKAALRRRIFGPEDAAPDEVEDDVLEQSERNAKKGGDAARA